MPKLSSGASFVKSCTPLEIVDGLWVKRDDQCCDDPPLAKIRGLFKFVERRPSFKAFGILDGRHSRNGWALARVCKHFGKQAVVYWPKRINETDEAQGETRDKAAKLGATCVGIQAGRSAVVFAAARSDLAQRERNSLIIPNAVKIEESVDAHIEEIAAQQSELKELGPASLVMSCGSGTMSAGILSGLFRIGLMPEVYLVTGYEQDENRLRRYLGQFSNFPQEKITILDQGLKYGSAENDVTGFCCPYYEAKAWNWMQFNRRKLAEPILFWNSGR